MSPRTFSPPVASRWLAVPGLALSLALGMAARPASSFAPIAGSAELAYTAAHILPVPDTPGHEIRAGDVRGTNKNEGSDDYFADAKVVNVEHADLVRGTGPHWGYYTMARGADTAVAKWQGQVTTTMKGNQPETRFSGTWEYVRGAGAYSDLKGKGTYEGQFLAQDRYVVRWKGTRAK